MIQLQAINAILNSNDIMSYRSAGIDKDYFNEYHDEYMFIMEHYKKYDKVPDWATFMGKFPDFQAVDVLEPTAFIISDLKEEYLFNKGVKLFQESASMLEENSYDGLKNIIAKAQKLLESNLQCEGTNINDMKQEKLDDIEEKKSRGNNLGISSGLPELDDILGGWLPGEELVTVVGRVNQGKSWLLQKFLTEANKQNKKVLLYSGEMGKLQVAYRHDTLGLNYSNRQLMKGTIKEQDLESYKESLSEQENRAPFIVITPLDLGGQMLSVSTLESYIIKYKPDIVGIDQISLMEDERRMKGDATRIQYTHISQDLFNLSIKYGIPIIADAQANRNKADVENPENPELADIGESDGIAQNSSRVISLVQTKMGLALKITKNRYGENNRKLIYSWDIDQGLFRYVSEEQQNNDTPIETNIPRNIAEVTNITDVF